MSRPALVPAPPPLLDHYPGIALYEGVAERVEKGRALGVPARASLPDAVCYIDNSGQNTRECTK